MAWMGENSLARTAGRNYASMAKGGVGSALHSLSKIPGKIAMHPIGGYGVMGGIAAAMTYDPTKRTVMSHAAQEGLKTATDVAFDSVLLGGLSLAGGFGMGLGMATIMGLGFSGLSPGETMGKIMRGAGEEYKKKIMREKTPIKQNERTMKATRQALNLLGQTGRQHSMLGSEAEYMHN